MRFVTTRAEAPPVTLKAALFEGLAPDGGLYVPEAIEPWSDSELEQLSSCTLEQIGVRTLEPFAASEIDEATLASVVREALDFPIPVVEIEPGLFALELFHGPTLAFKDVGARVMARLMAAFGRDVTILVATSGDTGSAVAHAFHGLAHSRVVILYPDRRVSPTQEAQLTMFNSETRSNVRAYAIAGSFDDCQRLVKKAFGDREIRQRVGLTSANSINVGRLLPQMIYYFHAIAQVNREAIVCTPSGNFGNLTAGVMAKRAGAPIERFVAATNANDVVPAYLATGHFEPRASIRTISNAMDVGNPSNFERLLWLYDRDLDGLRHDIVGSRHHDDQVRATIRDVYDRIGYVLDPHSAIGYLGAKGVLKHSRRSELDDHAHRATRPLQLDRASRAAQVGRLSEAARPSGVGIFLATAHPAKFPEVVEPIIGRTLEKPEALAHALSRPANIMRIDATIEAVREVLGA